MNFPNAFKLLETLKCPSCSTYMKEDIYVCLSGHSICNSCWNCKICPVCKLSLTDTRNFSLENVSALVLYPCDNEKNGCQQFFTTEELHQHHQVCDYRSYGCRLNKYCSWQGTRDKLKKHYLDKHDNNLLIGAECTCLWKESKPDCTTQVILAFEEMFYLHVHIKEGIFYWAVQYIGRSEDTILYCFEISILSDQFHDRKLQFSEICHDDIMEDIDEIIDSGFCVAVPSSILETYINQDDVLFYKIVIKRA